MIRWLKSLFAWERVNVGGPVWSYWQNRVTGERAAYRECSGAHQPLAMGWLEAGNGWRIVDVDGARSRRAV